MKRNEGEKIMHGQTAVSISLTPEPMRGFDLRENKF
jgi:hypothetical protein